MAYPNPSQGRFQLKWEEKLIDPLPYRVFDALGKKVREGELETGTNGFELDLAHHQPGIYFLEIQGKGRMKLIVQTQ